MLLVSGSIAYDQIMDYPGNFGDHIMPDKLHMINLSFLVDKLRKGFGGTAGNISYTLSLLGVRSALWGCAGQDFSEYRAHLIKRGVNLDYVKIYANEFTSSCFGITDFKDNQIWGFHEGADRNSPKRGFANFPKNITYGLIAPSNPKTMLKMAVFFAERNIPYMFDSGMQLPHFTGKDLRLAFKGAEIIIGNDYEVSLMEKRAGIPDLHQYYKGKKIIITTLGEKGARTTSAGEDFSIPAVLVKNPLDPAGSGDAFRAGFLAGYIKGFDLRTCTSMGCLAASYTVAKYGTQTHFFTGRQFSKKLYTHYKIKLDLHPSKRTV